MPRRRRLARAGIGAAQGALQGASQVSMTLLQNELLKRRQIENNAMMAERQREDDERTAALKTYEDFNTARTALFAPEHIQKYGAPTVKNQYDQLVSQLPQWLKTGLGPTPDFGALEAPIPMRVAPVRKTILDAKSPADVPGQLSLEGLLAEQRVNPAQDEEAFNAITQLASEAGQKRGELERLLPRTKQKYFDASGTEHEVNLTAPELAGRDFQTGQTPQQEASRSGLVTGAQEQAKTDVLLDPANVKGFASREDALSFARQRGQLRADQQMGAGSFAPQWDTIEDTDTQGNKIYRLIDKRHGGREGGTISTNLPSETITDGMRTSFSYAESARQAHNRMQALESKISGMPYAKARLQLSLDQINAPQMISDPAVRDYAQAMRVYINSQMRRESGAAVNETEYDRYGKSMAFSPGDDANTLTNKQNSRRQIIQGLTTQAGNRLGGGFIFPSEVAALAQQSGKTVQQIEQEAEAEGLRVVK